MRYQDTNLFFLQEDCTDFFGEEKGAEIFAESTELLNILLAGSDYKGNESVKNHMYKNMYPAIALYKSLGKLGFSNEEAYEFTLKETQKHAHNKKTENRKLLKIPFLYRVFRLVIKGFMKKAFPPEGWETEWVRCDADEIHFNLTRCIYADVTNTCGCPELCTVFCKNDDVAFSGYEPKVYFRRTGTLAEGAQCCDFHFVPAKAAVLSADDVNKNK